MDKLHKHFNSGDPLEAAELNELVDKINEGVDEINILAAENMTDSIYLDFTKTNPLQVVTGDVNGEVIQWIRRNSHRYLAKYTEAGKITICQLADDDSNYFAANGRTALLTGAHGDVMVHIPRFYYRVEEQAADKWHIEVSLVKISEEWQEWDGKDLIGVYEGFVHDGKLASRTGVASTGDVSQANFNSYARARGTGYTIVQWHQHCMMAFLFWAEYGNTNCQSVIGYGTDSYEKETGQTDEMGMHDTDAAHTGNTGSINFWGLENWWGNKAEWVDNVVVNPTAVNGVWRITDPDGTVREVQGPQTYASWIYPKSVTLGQKLDMIGKTMGGSTSGSLGDGQYIGDATSRVVLRSYYGANANGGVVFAGSAGGASDVSANIGARLAFRGEIHIETDVEAFIHLPVINPI